MNKKKLTSKQIKILQKVKKYLQEVMEKKLLKYKPETSYMPFQKAIVGERYRGIFSFVHSPFKVNYKTTRKPAIICRPSGSLIISGRIKNKS